MFKYLLVVLVLSQVCFAENSVNPVDVCLTNFYGAIDKVLVAAQEGVQSNWLDMVKNVMFAGADSIGDYEQCTMIQGSDCTKWVKDNWSAEQQKCLGLMQDFVGKCKKAHDDQASGKAWGDLSKDLVEVFQAMRNMNECLPH